MRGRKTFSKRPHLWRLHESTAGPMTVSRLTLIGTPIDTLNTKCFERIGRLYEHEHSLRHSELLSRQQHGACCSMSLAASNGIIMNGKVSLETKLTPRQPVSKTRRCLSFSLKTCFYDGLIFQLVKLVRLSCSEHFCCSKTFISDAKTSNRSSFCLLDGKQIDTQYFWIGSHTVKVDSNSHCASNKERSLCCTVPYYLKTAFIGRKTKGYRLWMSQIFLITISKLCTKY